MSDIIVYCVSGVVVDVEDIEDAPAAAIELYRESLTEGDGLGIKFDCMHLEGEVHNGKNHMWKHVIVGGAEVGIIP